MKKIHLLLSGALLLAVVAMLFVACQKDQTAVANQNQNASASDRSTIKATVNSIEGLISRDHAAAMAAAYAAQNPGKTQYVSFNVKDLAGFLNSISAKNGDKVYVNFGVYDKNTDPSGGANAGKITVFFTGSPFSPTDSGKDGSVQTNSTASPSYLNNGGIYP